MVSLWGRSSSASCDFFLFVYRSRYSLVCFGCFIKNQAGKRILYGTKPTGTNPTGTNPTDETYKGESTYLLYTSYIHEGCASRASRADADKKRSSHLTRPNSGVGRQRSSSSCGRVRLQHGFAALQSPPLAARARTWARPTNKVKEGTSTGLSATKIDR